MRGKNKFKPVYCCREIAEQIDESYMFCHYETVPFTTREIKPAVFVMSDGGHGGMVEIFHCPFCGNEILFEELE